MLGLRGMGMGGGNHIDGGVASVKLFDQDFYLRYGLSVRTSDAMVRQDDSPKPALGRW